MPLLIRLTWMQYLTIRITRLGPMYTPPAEGRRPKATPPRYPSNFHQLLYTFASAAMLYTWLNWLALLSELKLQDCQTTIQWLLDSGFNDDLPSETTCCVWDTQILRCNFEGRIKSIWLYNDKLNGTLSPLIGNLTSLESL
jgi:hypothetical protein